MDRSREAPPFVRLGPDRPASPVVLSVPHAGRAYSANLLAASRLPVEKLEMLEDRLVDELVRRAAKTGATALIALAPRAEIDLNRDERELDRSMVAPAPPASASSPSPRTRGGLGLVPARISGAGAIWRRPMSPAELERRMRLIHRPYHQALRDALEAARSRFGVAILLDCHSMPPQSGNAVGAGAPLTSPAGLVFGDRHGTSIAAEFMAAAMGAAEALDFSCAQNLPYAGGHITERHGRPAHNIHALQLEIDRTLYLARDLRSPGSGFERTARMIEAVTLALAARALEPPQAIAAE